MILIKKNYFCIGFLLLISCGGGKFVEKSAGSEDVNLATSIDQNQCEYISEIKGKVKGYSDGFYDTTKKNLVQLGKNAAIDKNGNTIIMSDYKQHRGTQSAIFQIFKCS